MREGSTEYSSCSQAIAARTSRPEREFGQGSHKMRRHQDVWQPEDSLPDQGAGRVGRQKQDGRDGGGALNQGRNLAPRARV